MEQWLTLHNPSTAQGQWYLEQLLFLPQTAPEHSRQNPYHTHPERLGAQSFPQPAPPAFPPGQSPEALQQTPRLTQPPRNSRGEATTRMGPSRTARTAELWPEQWPAGTSPGTPRGLGNTGQRTARRWRPRSQLSPWDPWRLGQRNCCLTSPAETRSPASQPQRTHRHGGATGRRREEFCPPRRPGADCSEHTRAAARRAPPVARHAPRAHPLQGRGWRRTPSRASAEGSAGAAGSGLPGHPARPRRRVPVAHPGRGPLDRLARHRQAWGIPAPCRPAAGAHPGLLYDGGPLAASSPATHRQRSEQEAGTGVGQPPHPGLEPQPGGASTGRMAGKTPSGPRTS